MRLRLRLDSITPKHIVQTLFIDGRNCGTIVLDHGEYQLFGAALLLGAQQMKGHLVVEIDPVDHDSDGHFAMPRNRKQ